MYINHIYKYVYIYIISGLCGLSTTFNWVCSSWSDLGLDPAPYIFWPCSIAFCMFTRGYHEMFHKSMKCSMKSHKNPIKSDLI